MGENDNEQTDMGANDNEENSSIVAAATWKQIAGSEHWKGLLNPLNPDLRKYILIYGDHAETTYDAFITDRHSKYAGFCRYSAETIFDDVGVVRAHRNPPWMHVITRFVYATAASPVPLAFLVHSLSREAWDKESNWMGYVAVTSDATTLGRRDITVSWRGTVQSLEWLDDFDLGRSDLKTILPSSSSLFHDEDYRKARVQRGWMTLYTSTDARSPFTKSSAREQIHQELRRLLRLYATDARAGRLSITMTGHSLGAALATLCAFDVCANAVNAVPDSAPAVTVPVTVLAFASPKVGNSAFKRALERLPDLRVLRVVNERDVVPLFPMVGCEHVGQELRVDSRKSPFVKNAGDFQCWHDLNGYLHAVAGTRAPGLPFELQADRDVALVNKWLDWLRDDLLVPPSWWVPLNKGMAQGSDGHWTLQEPPSAHSASSSFPSVE